VYDVELCVHPILDISNQSSRREDVSCRSYTNMRGIEHLKVVDSIKQELY